MEEEKKHRKWIHIPLLIGIFGLFAATAWYYFTQYDSFTRENLRAFISAFGAWAPVAYAVLYVVSAPIPFLAPALSAVGGLLFGTFWGTVLVLVIASGSALVPFMMARHFGREWVESKLKGKKLEEIYEQSEGGKGFTFVILLRLIPLLPWEIQNYVAGLTKVAIPTFILGTIVGIIPGSFSLVFLGSAATDPASWQFAAAIVLKVLTALIPVIYLYFKNRGAKKVVAST